MGEFFNEIKDFKDQDYFKIFKKTLLECLYILNRMNKYKYSHLDVKKDNIMLKKLGKKYQVVFIDFGLTKKHNK